MAATRNRGKLWPLILMTVLYAALLPVAVGAAVMSPMASDAGVNDAVWTFILAMFTWPAGIALGVIAAWIFYAAAWRRAMWLALLFPLLWLGPIAWSMAVGFRY